MKNNYFEIPNSEELYCSVWRYRPQHSSLKLRVHQNTIETLYWLTFVVPIYFTCPNHWKGTNFRIGTPEEQKTVSNYILKHKDTHKYIKEYTLFVAEVDKDLSTYNVVKILAMSAEAKKTK